MTAASRRLDGIERVVIAVDEANDASNAVPRKLGFTMRKVVERPAAAPSETGRFNVWVHDVPAADTEAADIEAGGTR